MGAALPGVVTASMGPPPVAEAGQPVAVAVVPLSGAVVAVRPAPLVSPVGTAVLVIRPEAVVAGVSNAPVPAVGLPDDFGWLWIR